MMFAKKHVFFWKNGIHVINQTPSGWALLETNKNGPFLFDMNLMGLGSDTDDAAHSCLHRPQKSPSRWLH